MKKNHFIFLLAVVGVTSIIFLVKSKAKKKNLLILKEVVGLHQEAESKIEKIIQLKNDVNNITDITPSEQEALFKELEEIEEKLCSWKESVASILNVANTLKNKKNKVTKEMHDKLAAAQSKFSQLSDQFEKSIKKIGATMERLQYQQ